MFPKNDNSVKLFSEGRTEQLKTGIVPLHLHTLNYVLQSSYSFQNMVFIQNKGKSLQSIKTDGKRNTILNPIYEVIHPLYLLNILPYILLFKHFFSWQLCQSCLISPNTFFPQSTQLKNNWSSLFIYTLCILLGNKISQTYGMCIDPRS